MTSYNGPAMTSKRRRHPDLKPAHPGELLREIVIPGTGKTKVTPAIAMRLGKMCGDGPEVWLRMQNACDIWELDRDLKKDLAKIPRLTAA